MVKNKIPTNYFLFASFFGPAFIIMFYLRSCSTRIDLGDYYLRASIIISILSFMVSITAWKVLKDERN